ncbi:high nitrogen upregulated cytochrome P450 monooxygenase 2 [Crucibulum laeve]|uniref:High nitrogen upregulated cytochrome P450 monooxygenase 2 n=1 Tax=Crucibulum laeve TaxID=68775 RepID=A0A5C3LVR4_9AGAR|nr:high nitrogen upregulated cytochrome P450 monooxygenase 2 [Crucibulum laeve]
MASALTQAVIFDILSGVSAHLWLKVKEPTSLLTLFAALAVIPIPSIIFLRYADIAILHAVGVAYSVFLATLLSSVVVYRISPFHPLAKYPGPLAYKISKLWAVWKASGGKLHICYQELHQEYGPIVRVGPNELSIIEEDLIPSILGTYGMPKGPLWDGRKITPPSAKPTSDFNLIGNRDQARHAQLRKAWNKAFASSPIADYEEILVRRAAQLVEHLDILCKSAPNGVGRTDITHWINYFSFDFMGDIAFGGGFELMRDGDKDNIWHTMETALILPGLAQHIPWSAKVLRALPFVGSSTRTFGAFISQQARRRASQEPKQKDLFYHLLNALDLQIDSSVSPLPFIFSNTALAVIAGSDTTASAISNTIYYLLSHPEYYSRLQKEIAHAVGPATELSLIDLSKLSALSFLNAVINETLRLQPAVPTGLQRAPAIGSGGKLLGSIFIPEGTAVTVPPYALHRDPRYFSPNPDKFWPERWMKHDSDAKVVVNRGAFIPFSQGPANCAGKTLAILELRLVLALLIQRFDMAFDDGYDPAVWEQSLTDTFVFSKGKLPIKLTRRI